MVEKNKHHLINKCRAEDGYNVSHPDNIRPMIVNDHINHHNYLWNLTPQEQLVAIFTLNSSTLNKYARQLMRELQNMEREDFYKSHLLK